MSDVTQMLGQIENGDGQAAEKLLPLPARVVVERRDSQPAFAGRPIP